MKAVWDVKQRATAKISSWVHLDFISIHFSAELIHPPSSGQTWFLDMLDSSGISDIRHCMHYLFIDLLLWSICVTTAPLVSPHLVGGSEGRECCHWRGCKATWSFSSFRDRFGGQFRAYIYHYWAWIGNNVSWPCRFGVQLLWHHIAEVVNRWWRHWTNRVCCWSRLLAAAQQGVQFICQHASWGADCHNNTTACMLLWCV